MFLKRTFLISLLLVLAVIASACSASTSSKEKGKEEKASKHTEIEVKNVEYVLPAKGESADEGEIVLKIDVSVKNTGKEATYIGDNNFQLYSDDTQLASTNPEDYNEKLKHTNLSPGKKMNGSLFYLVEKGKKFQLIYTLEEFTDGKMEQETIEFDIDGSDEKILKTADKLQDSAKALQAYVDIFYYGKDNKDFEKITGDNKEENLKQFDDILMEEFMNSSELEEEQVDKEGLRNMIAAMKSVLHEKVPAKMVTKSISKDIAIVELTAKPLEISSMESVLEEKATSYVTNNPNATELDIQKFIFGTMANEFKNAQASSKEVTVEIRMKKAGEGQWQIDDHHSNEDMSKPFFNF